MRVLSFLCVAILVPISVLAETGTIDGIRYEFNDESATVIQSDGQKYSGRIVIPEQIIWNGKNYTVTCIGSEAFSHCEDLTDIELPSSIKEIGGWAFLWCTGLSDIDIPDSVKMVSSDAFYCCKNMTVYNGLRYADSFLIEAVDTSASEFVVREGTRWIGDNAFSKCSQMRTLSLPESIEVVGNFSFSGCTSLAALELPSSISLIGMQAFAFSGLQHLICKAVIPPVVLRVNDRDKYFENVGTDKCRLKVCRGSRKAYLNDVSWNEFRHIRE